MVADPRDRQPEDRTQMQIELREILRTERDHARVVGARRELAEDHLVALHEELDAEDARAILAREALDDGARHPLGRALGRGLHRAGHPRLLVVAAFLPMADRLDELHAAAARRAFLDREQRDLVVEVDELLHDHDLAVAAHVVDGVPPRLGDVGLGAHHRLALA